MYSQERIDETEPIRRKLVHNINSRELDRLALATRYGQVWSTDEATADFEFLGFMAPFAVVTQRSTGKKGSLMFQDMPRFYFSWRPQEG
jgi:hypothetical protein